jgi:OFA family oxalate/formate antiporter-like MFS transporter
MGTWQWYALWALLFLNTSAGIAIISHAAPMAQEITGAAAAGLVGTHFHRQLRRPIPVGMVL